MHFERHLAFQMRKIIFFAENLKKFGFHHMRGSRKFCQAQRPENGLDNFFFFSPHLTLHLTEGVQLVLLQRKLYFFKDLEGVQHFPGGCNFFQGGGGGFKC